MTTMLLNWIRSFKYRSEVRKINMLDICCFIYCSYKQTCIKCSMFYYCMWCVFCVDICLQSFLWSVVIVMGWGLLGYFSLCCYFLHFTVLSKRTLAFVYHVHIWQVSLQRLIWMWVEESNMYFCHIDFLLMEKLTKEALVSKLSSYGGWWYWYQRTFLKYRWHIIVTWSVLCFTIYWVVGYFIQVIK